MNNFESITQSPETLGIFLSGLSVADGLWDLEFQRRFCNTCERENCDACPHAEIRNNPTWWLELDVEDMLLQQSSQSDGTRLTIDEITEEKAENELAVEYDSIQKGLLDKWKI